MASETNSGKNVREELFAALQEVAPQFHAATADDRLPLKSLNILYLVTKLEKRLNRKFTFEEITSPSFQTISGILQILENKRT